MVDGNKGASAPAFDSLVSAILAILAEADPKGDAPRKSVRSDLLDTLSEALAELGR